MTSVQELLDKIKHLEMELEREKDKHKQIAREKINEMSSEVVDTNPYR